MYDWNMECWILYFLAILNLLFMCVFDYIDDLNSVGL